MSEYQRVRQFLEAASMLPRKARGQNFMVEPNTLERIRRVAHVRQGESIIEIGPGLGALTSILVEGGAHVVAIEIEEAFAREIEERYEGKVRVIRGDAAHADVLVAALEAMRATPKGCRLFGNLPYSAGTAILQNVYQYSRAFREAIVLLQEEVVTRLTAPPGAHERGYLTVLTEAHAEISRLLTIGPSAFYPRPKVNSALACLRFHEHSLVSKEREPLFLNLLNRSFQQRRKMLRNSLPEIARILTDSDAAGHAELESFAGRRPGTLSIHEYLHLQSLLEQHQQPPI